MLMQRLAPYLGIVVVILVGAFLIIFSGRVTVLRPSKISTLTASSTLAVVPGFTLLPISLPNNEPTDVSTNSPKPTGTAPEKEIAPTATQTPASTRAVSPAAPQVPSSGNSALDASAVALRKALVNVICYAPADSTLRSISGSGVIIDQRGSIITDAHVAQYFLLVDRGVSCVIRMGSPATYTYRASLMYISPAWLGANADVLSEVSPSGTGQYDFAFLAITASAASTELPTTFPFVPLATAAPNIGAPVAIAAYGAQYLAPSQILSSLFPTVVFDSIRDVFTFALNTIDAFSLGGSAAAQEGSSGGGVVDNQGNLIGILTTSTASGDTSTRTLDAITTSYIRAEYASETGHTLDSLLIQSPALVSDTFASHIPALESIITAHLP